MTLRQDINRILLKVEEIERREALMHKMILNGGKASILAKIIIVSLRAEGLSINEIASFIGQDNNFVINYWHKKDPVLTFSKEELD